MKNSIYKETQSVTPPWQEVYSVSKTVVIDSRQRNCAAYKTPSLYKIQLGDVFKNINSIELKGAIIPKSSYNIHSSNNKIDFGIGDTITGFKILARGSGYTSPPTVTIFPPPNGGVTALAHAILTPDGTILSIVIDNPGSGYIPSAPPYINISAPTNRNQSSFPKVKAIVGNIYTAVLRPGEYELGGNPNPPTSSLPSKLLLEIQNAMNYAVTGVYNPASNSPFACRVVSQYPTLTATPGTPEAFETNACKFNRIQVINVNSDIWQFLWCSGPSEAESAASVFGFNTVDSNVGVPVPAINTIDGNIIPAGTAIRGTFDYNLNNDPDYVVLTIIAGDNNIDRIKSLDDGIDNRFCVLLFDNNTPETLHDLSGTIVNSGGIDYLQGPVTKGTFWRPTVSTKPSKGSDYDIKKITFKPPISKLTSLTIMFTKYGFKQNAAPHLYDMEGREHLLLFEVSATDNRSKMKE